MNTIKIDNKNVKMIAHRGLSGLEKENTCSAFVAAGNRATYFGIETDVHRTVDGRYVIFHDDNTKRVGLDSMVIEETTFDTLRNLQLTDVDGKRGRIDLRMPELMEYIGICQKYEKVAVLELKNAFEAEDVITIAEKIQKAGYFDKTVFISFVLENLVILKNKFPEAKAQYLIENAWDDSVLDALVKYDLSLDIDFHLLTEDIVRRVHDLGKEVNVWTVNTKEDGDRMVAMGVDYITTNILEGVKFNV